MDVIKNEKVALDRLRVRQNVFLVRQYFCTVEPPSLRIFSRRYFLQTVLSIADRLAYYVTFDY